MKSKKHTIFLVLVAAGIAFAIVLILCFLDFSSARSRSAAGTGFESSSPARPSATSNTEYRKKEAESVLAAYSAPLKIYGIVVDESGSPVAGARVHLSISDKYFGRGSEWIGVSDQDGLFSVEGLKGASVSVTVSKEGYYSLRDKSDGYFAFGVPNTQLEKRELPTKDKPAVFILKKRGEASPLISRDWDAVLPLDGTAVGIDLGRGRKSEQGDLILVARANKTNTDPNSHEKYDWHFKMSIPGGGFLSRTNEFDFIAPDSGYQPEIEFDMTRDDAKWRDDCGGEYFLKLGDGRYARMKLRFTTGGAHFASITSYLNPVPGDRNLEYDPQKKAKP